MTEDQKKFECWAIVEIFGHQMYAGKVTEQQIGGCNFVRLDVPGHEQHQPFTKLFGQGAIYAITPVTEETAKAKANVMRQTPLDTWDIRQALGINTTRSLGYSEGDEEDGLGF